MSLTTAEKTFWSRYKHHLPHVCCDGPCPIHAPSDHHMRAWPLHWRADRHIAERVCPHGIGHPDPDQLLLDGGVHGCDGCCKN